MLVKKPPLPFLVRSPVVALDSRKMEKKGGTPSGLLMRQILLYLGSRMEPALARPLSAAWNAAVAPHSTLVSSGGSEYGDGIIPEPWFLATEIAKMTSTQLRSLQELHSVRLPPAVLHQPRGLSKPYLVDLKRLHVIQAFRGVSDPLMRLPSLEELTLRSDTEVSNMEPQISIEHLPKLRALRIDAFQAVILRVPAFVSLRVLELFSLNSNRVFKAELDAVGRALPELDTLGLYATYYRDSDQSPLSSFTACSTRLKWLTCWEVARVDTSAAWSHFSNLERLEYQSLDVPELTLSTPPTVSELWIPARELDRVIPRTRARFLYVLTSRFGSWDSFDTERADTLKVLGWGRMREMPDRLLDSQILRSLRTDLIKCWRFEMDRPFRLLEDEQKSLELIYRNVLSLLVERIVRNHTWAAETMRVQDRNVSVQRPPAGGSTWRVHYSLDQGTGLTHSLVDTLEGPLSRGEIGWLDGSPLGDWPVRHLVWGELEYSSDGGGGTDANIVVVQEEDERTDTDDDEDTKRGDYKRRRSRRRIVVEEDSDVEGGELKIVESDSGQLEIVQVEEEDSDGLEIDSD